MSRHPECVRCGDPVTCGQHDGAGRPAHYSCLGTCQSCFSRPASTVGGVCSQCARPEGWWDDDTEDKQ